jgi:hypothetical protein
MRPRSTREPQPPAWLIALVNVVIVAGLLWLLSKGLPLSVGLIIVIVVVALVIRDGLH